MISQVRIKRKAVEVIDEWSVLSPNINEVYASLGRLDARTCHDLDKA